MRQPALAAWRVSASASSKSAGLGGGESAVEGSAQRAERGGARAEPERLAAGEAMRTVHQGCEHSMAAIGASGAMNAILRTGIENGNEFR